MSAPLPEPRPNADSAEFWAQARDGKLILRQCSACGMKHFPPRHLCPGCWSSELQWTPASGNATVHTFTIMRRAPVPEFVSQIPYVVALIDLDEGPRMMANIIGDDALGIAIGERVTLCFEERGEYRLPQFRRVS